MIVLVALSALTLNDYGELPAGSLDAEITFVAPDAGEPNEEPWWLTFDDPNLVQAIETGLTNNYDVKTAAARIVQAEAASLRALAPLLPQITADLDGRVAPFDSLGFQFGGGLGGGAAQPPSVFYTANALLNARWQLDVWGQSYLAYEAAELQAKASAGDRDSIALSLAEQIANAYFDVVAAKNTMELVANQIEANNRLLELIELRFERGESTGLDVLQQRQQTASRAAELPPLRAQLRVAQQRLAILLGAPPSKEAPPTAAQLPTLPEAPSLGRPIDLLENRPDLRSAYHQWQAANQRADSADRVHLPSLSVNGNAGYQYFRATELRSQRVWGAGASLSLPLFSGFGDVGSTREASALESQSLNTLSQSYLNAINEVESALVNESETREQLRLLEDQAVAASAALEESEARYVAGLTNYLTVLTALSADQQVQRLLLQVERALVTSRLQLYRSLGGPWSRALSGSAGDLR